MSAEDLVPTRWQPGQTGNPGGRPKKRPILDDLTAELEKPSNGKADHTKRQAMVERLVSIALNGRRSESLAAMKLIFAYQLGLPVQAVEVDIWDAARRMAERSGADPDWLVKRAREIAAEAMGGASNP